MYLSQVKLAPNWKQFLYGTYHIHCRICMAFPSHPRFKNDPNFLQPFLPEDFITGKIHTKRTETDNFLFRVQDNLVVVQSGVRPDFNYSFINAKHLLAEPPVTKEISLQLEKGRHFTFNLQANPTYPRTEENKKTIPILKREDLLEWLNVKAEQNGFKTTANLEIHPQGLQIQKRSSRSDELFKHNSVIYTGMAEVTDAEKFYQGRIQGIGRAKSFGYGLLMVKPFSKTTA